MVHGVRPSPGFNWSAVSWGGPDQSRSDQCSYCDAPFRDDEIPLMMWNRDKWCAEFCEACQEAWWGLS